MVPRLDTDTPDRSVYLWTVRLEASAEQVEQLAVILSADELDRMLRFKFPHLRSRFALSRAALRTLLGRALSVPPPDLVFAYAEYGKPYLAGNPLQFNSSHTDELFACVLTLHCEIGLDIEKITPLAEASQIARSHFCPEEQQHFESLPRAEQQAAFFRCWTRKEAYLKAVGTGLSTDLNSFQVTLRAADPAKLLHVDGNRQEAGQWTVEDLMDIPGHAGALVYRDRTRPVLRYPMLTAADLLQSFSRPLSDGLSVP